MRLRGRMVSWVYKTLCLIHSTVWGWGRQSLMLPGEAYEAYTILPQVLYASTYKISPRLPAQPSSPRLFPGKSAAGISVIPTDLSFKPSRELTGPRSQSSESKHSASASWQCKLSLQTNTMWPQAVDRKHSYQTGKGQGLQGWFQREESFFAKHRKELSNLNLPRWPLQFACKTNVNQNCIWIKNKKIRILGWLFSLF